MKTIGATRGDGEESSPASCNPRICTGGCGQPIPVKRLAALPNTRICVTCLESQGDVAPTRRLDEFTSDGDRVETYFTEEPRLERHMQHMNTAVPDPLFYGIAVGDDSELVREGDSVIDTARPLRDEFDDDENEIEERPALVGFHLEYCLTLENEDYFGKAA